MCKRCEGKAYREAFASRSIIQPDLLSREQRDYVTAIERLAAIQKLQEQLDRIKAQL